MRRVRARDIVRLWETLRTRDVDPFSPGGRAALRDAAVASLGATEVPVEELFRSLTLASGDGSSFSPRLVFTAPIALPGALKTRDVVRSIFGTASRSIVVAGFNMQDEEFRSLLMDAGMGGLDVTVIADRQSGHGWELSRDWPPGATPLRSLQDVEGIGGKRTAMHAKALVADRNRALIGSANFTWSGLQGNLEVGLLVEGEVAADLVAMWETLVARGVLVPIAGMSSG